MSVFFRACKSENASGRVMANWNDARGFCSRGAVRTSKMKLATPIDLTVHGAAQRFPLYSFRNINYKYKYILFLFRKNKNYACCFYLDFNWICQKSEAYTGVEEYSMGAGRVDHNLYENRNEFVASSPAALAALFHFPKVFPTSVHLGEDREWKT